MKSQLFAALVGLSTSLAYANTYQTYVIPTFGNASLVPIVQAELATGQGGSVNWYQNQLIVYATPSDYARILRLLEQVDVAPTPITLSLRAELAQDGRTNSHHIQAGIDRRVWINGSYQNTSYQAQQNSHYQVRGVTGAPMRISQNTLIQLINQSQTLISSPYGTPIVIRLTNHQWLTLSDGFSAQATPLPDGTFRLSINQSAQLGNSQQTTQSTLVVPRGHWTQLGWIEQQASHRGTGTYQSQTTQLPIWVKLD